MAKKHKGRHHAQQHPHHHLSSHAPNVGHDGMTHESHHAGNKEVGLPHAFGGEESYQDGGCDHHLGDNVAEED